MDRQSYEQCRLCGDETSGRVCGPCQKAILSTSMGPPNILITDKLDMVPLLLSFGSELYVSADSRSAQSLARFIADNLAAVVFSIRDNVVASKLRELLGIRGPSSALVDILAMIEQGSTRFFIVLPTTDQDIEIFEMYIGRKPRNY